MTVSLNEFSKLINTATEVFSNQSSLLGPYNFDSVAFVGDTHGADHITKYALKLFESGEVEGIVFLGDYVDRGPNGVENLEAILNALLSAKDKVIVIRGNHESPLTNLYYGFYKEVLKKFNETVYEDIKNMFSVMPYGAVVNNYLCVHGAISINMTSLDEIKNLIRPDEGPNDPEAFQVLWNDPRDMFDGYIPSVRGDGIYYVGRDILEKFIEGNKLKGIIRGHEAVDGFKLFLNGKVVTVFSSAYHGQSAGILEMFKEGIKMLYLDPNTLQKRGEIETKDLLEAYKSTNL